MNDIMISYKVKPVLTFLSQQWVCWRQCPWNPRLGWSGSPSSPPRTPSPRSRECRATSSGCPARHAAPRPCHAACWRASRARHVSTTWRASCRGSCSQIGAPDPHCKIKFHYSSKNISNATLPKIIYYVSPL